MAWRQSPGGSEQHLTRAAAAARTRTQRPGKHLAVHASELVVKPDFQILRRYRRYADVHVALFEDAIVSEQNLDIVAHLQEWVAERLDIVDQFWRKVLMYAADSEIGRMHAATRGTLIEGHQLLALLERPQRWGERAHVHGLGGDIEQMRKQPSDFAIEDADELRTARDRDAQKLFRRQAERMLLVHRRDIVEAVEIRDRLQIG